MTRANKGVCDRVSVRKYYVMISVTNKKKILKLSTTTRKCLSLCDDFKTKIASELVTCFLLNLKL